MYPVNMDTDTPFAVNILMSERGNDDVLFEQILYLQPENKAQKDFSPKLS